MATGRRRLGIYLTRHKHTGWQGSLAQRLRRISPGDRRAEARAFLEQFCAESGRGREAFQTRWAEVRRALRRTDSYEHTPEELAFGARVAWRNHGRCIGRLFWESLEVFDCRHVTDPAEMAGQVVRHMRDALGDGRIRSMITIFAPVTGDRLPPWVESYQITQYAGHSLPDGRILGDRQNIEPTRIARSLGWTPPDEPGRFDPLPFVIRDEKDRRLLFQLPDDAWREVAITHPDLPAIAEMGLRWYAVPCVSNMILTIGGIEYPCAPFNGFYMGTEIASRNFADTRRYDLLPEIARALGLDPAAAGPQLWRDTALTEINRAVLHSYQAAGVTMVDHHSASNQFMEFHRREQSSGRRVPADWRWIVPPQASGTCEVFHLRMRNFHPVPNFYSARAEDGYRLMPFYGDRQQNRLEAGLDRIRRRWTLWKRTAW